MQFEYYSFDVSVHADEDRKIEYVLRPDGGIRPGHFRSLTNPTTGESSVTTNASEGVRVVVHPIGIRNDDNLGVSDGSGIFILAVELVAKFAAQLDASKIEKLYVDVSSNVYATSEFSNVVYVGMCAFIRA